MLEVTRRSRWLRYVNTVIGAKENAIQGLLSPIHIARGFGLTGSLCQSVFNSCLKMGDCNPRVLSIQSHVVSGYVGNKSATFPLQVLGFDVDAINSVQFSNHTGYGYWKGQVLAEEELVDLSEGLAHNGLDCCYTHLLTGYNRSKSFLTHIANTVCELRKKNPGLIYLCDPVMGDIGRGVYVPTELIEVYRDVIVPIANIITPNQFELELLTGKPVKSLDDAWDALGILHSMGPKVAVISSSELSDEDSLLCLGSMIVEGKRERAMVTFPKLEGSYTGTGDLFSALFLAWMWRTNQNMKQSLEFTIATIYAVLKRTESSKQCSGDNDKASVSGHELKLIQSKSDIENPNVIYHALPVLP